MASLPNFRNPPGTPSGPTDFFSQFLLIFSDDSCVNNEGFTRVG